MAYYRSTVRCINCGEESSGKMYCNHCYRIEKKIFNARARSLPLDKFIEIKRMVKKNMAILDDKTFLTPDDIEDSEQFVIMDPGVFEDHDFGTVESPNVKKIFNITVSAHEQEFTYSMNMKSRINFIRSFGKDTTKWVGKKGIFIKVKQNVFGKIKDVIYVEPVKE